jgi:hypothetical protein
MNDDDIHELVDRKQNETYDRLENTCRTLTDSIFMETQGIKKSIDNLTTTVKEQNSSVKKLKEWKDGMEGEKVALKEVERKRLSNFQVFGIICGAIISLIAVLGFIKGMNTTKQIDLIGKELYWKADRIPDSTVRSYKMIPITEDTAFINRLERSTNKLK